MNAYPPELRARARDLWLRERLSDEALAERLGVSRSGTIGDWRREENWGDLRRAVDDAASARIEAEQQAAQSKIDQRHDQIGEALEAMVVRCLKAGGNARAGELRAIASVAMMAQRMRRTANQMDAKGARSGAKSDTKSGSEQPGRLKRVVFSIAPRPSMPLTDTGGAVPTRPAPQAR